jgi:hypothetical protein
MVYAEVMRLLQSLLLAILLAISASAQDAKKALPRFEAYPVAVIFKGKPADPILPRPEERL